MADINDGGPAFPILERGANGLELTNPGMSLRDHFAGLALAGLLADLPKTLYGLDWKENVSRESYALADEMLKAREPRNG